MTLPNERTRSVWITDRFLTDLLRKPRVPEWIRDQARRCLRHFPIVSDMLRLEEFELKRQGAPKQEIQAYIESQRQAYKKMEQDRK